MAFFFAVGIIVGIAEFAWEEGTGYDIPAGIDFLIDVTILGTLASFVRIKGERQIKTEK